MNILNFFSGDCFDAYKYFGVHKYWKMGEEGYIFRVYAPNAEAVDIICDKSDWKPVSMHKDKGGIFSLFMTEAEEGMRYKYRIHQQNGEITDRADPYGFKSELRPDNASVVIRLDNFEFTDVTWMRNRSQNYNFPMNIYELHFGSWKMKPHDEDEPEKGWYKYSEIADELIKYLKDNYFTHVEILPLAEHPFDGSWGYQVSGFFSVTSRYGDPQDLMYFVNECHKNNIGVIMDFVPVHFVSDMYALAMFDGTPVYEYEHPDIANSQWGSKNFNFYSTAVQSFLKSAANFWLDRYHIDGLRMDAINNAIYWQGDKERGVNKGAVEFIKSMNDGLKKLHKGIMLIAEDSSNYLKVTAPVQYDGLGFDYKWDMGWMNDTIEFFQYTPEERRRNYHQLSFSMLYFYNDIYLLPISHDEVVHGKATIMQKMWGDYEYKFPQCRTFYTYMFTHPGKKLNFMGNEIGQFREWDENKEIDWFMLKYPVHDSFYHYFRELCRIYYMTPALYADEYDSGAFRWLEVDACNECVYAYQRTVLNSSVIVVLNLSPDYYESFKIGVDEPVIIEEILNSDSLIYSGKGRVNSGKKIIVDRVPYKNHNYSFDLKIAPFGSMIFKVCGKSTRTVKVKPHSNR